MKPSSTQAPRYLTLAQASFHAGLSTRTIRRAIAAGKIPAHRIGRLIRIDADDFCDWVEGSPVPPIVPPEFQS